MRASIACANCVGYIKVFLCDFFSDSFFFIFYRRRIETYRRRQTECVPRFDQSFTGACEQQNLETTALQKRFLEGKAKRQAKKNDRKPDLPAISGNLHSSVVHVVSYLTYLPTMFVSYIKSVSWKYAIMSCIYISLIIDRSSLILKHS